MWRGAARSGKKAERNKQQLFDVWHTHTKDCYVCQKALKRVTWTIRVALGLAIAFFDIGLMIEAKAAGAMAATDSSFVMPPLSFWVAIALSVLLAAVGYGLIKLQRLFFVYEFDHATNN